MNNEVNERNKVETEKILTSTKPNTEHYYDINSKSTKIILLILGLIVLVGVGYYLFKWFTT